MGEETGQSDKGTGEKVSAEKAIVGPKGQAIGKFQVRRGSWKKTEYALKLAEYANQDILPHEKGVYDAFYNAIIEKYDFTNPEDLMLIDLACYDFIRIKRLQKMIMKDGDVIKVVNRLGATLSKANEASYLLNAVQVQFRQTMKELTLTRKEKARKEIGMDSKSFDQWLADNVIPVEQIPEEPPEEEAKKEENGNTKEITQ